MTLLLLLAGVSALAAVGLIPLRGRLRRPIAVVKALNSDPRLPKPLRYALRVGLIVKLWPGPDFGIDELLLGGCALVLVLFYRPTLRTIIQETK
jgi:hypothetical protein